MRVLTFLHSFELGGVERIALRLVREWRERGVEAPLFLGRLDGDMVDVGRDLDLITPRRRWTWLSRWETIWMVVTLPAVIRDEKPDILFCAGNTYAVIAFAMKLLLGRRCPPIIAKISNNLDREDKKWWKRRTYRFWLWIQGRFIDHFVGLEEPAPRAALWSAAWLMRMPGSVLPGVVPGGTYLVAVALIALVIVWSANLYNFMDGSDGIAGATTLIGFAAYAIAADGDTPLRLACVALAAAAVPFLAVNRPPARMFLGDVGAVPAGFLAAMLGIGGALRGDWPAWFPVLVFLPFVGDASWTLLRRLLRGERVWEAHCMHYYQRLNQLGAGHAGTLALYGGLTAAAALTALVCRARAPESGGAALLAWSIALAILFAAIDYHWRRKPSATR